MSDVSDKVLLIVFVSTICIGTTICCLCGSESRVPFRMRSRIHTEPSTSSSGIVVELPVSYPSIVVQQPSGSYEIGVVVQK